MLDRIGRPLWLAFTAALMAATLWMVFVWVPTEANLGIVQRAFYVHVPIAWVAMVAMIPALNIKR